MSNQKIIEYYNAKIKGIIQIKKKEKEIRKFDYCLKFSVSKNK